MQGNKLNKLVDNISAVSFFFLFDIYILYYFYFIIVIVLRALYFRVCFEMIAILKLRTVSVECNITIDLSTFPTDVCVVCDVTSMCPCHVCNVTSVYMLCVTSQVCVRVVCDVTNVSSLYRVSESGDLKSSSV